MSASSHSVDYLAAAASLVGSVDPGRLDAMARGLAEVRERDGRLFVLGVGGGAGHASHAVNDFRKLCGLESYAPTDNVSELTARINDEGWETSFSAWLAVSRVSARDALLIFSVGGGSREMGVSVNLVMRDRERTGRRRFALRRRRSSRAGRSPRPPTSRSHSARPRLCARPSSSHYRRSSGTRWYRTRRWPFGRVAGSRSSSQASRESGHVSRSRRRPQRACR